MSSKTASVQIDPSRLKSRFDSLAAIGATAAGGVDRTAFGPAHLEARHWFEEEARSLGLKYSGDEAGNQSALLECGPAGAPHLLIGSHLDSVPDGGRYDGALGVVCALEVLAAVKEAGLRLDYHLEAVGFCDEEGHHMALMGSRSMAGVLDAAELGHPSKGMDEFQRVLALAGLKYDEILNAKRDPETLAAYLELHIEQGAVLEKAGIDIGIVTGFVGIRAFRFLFKGRADHAGTTPMDQRIDPVPAASAFCLSAREAVMEEFMPGVVTVGNMEFSPGAFNVVPSEVKVWLEFRADAEDVLDAMQARIMGLAQNCAAAFGAVAEVQPVEKALGVATSIKVRGAMQKAADELGLSSRHMPSGAGHDCQNLAWVCPAGLVFVPSQDGASHSPREFTPWEDCENGARVLLLTALKLAGAE